MTDQVGVAHTQQKAELIVPLTWACRGCPPSPSLTPSRPASEEAAGRPWCSSDCSKPRWGPLTLILTPGGKKDHLGRHTG